MTTRANKPHPASAAWLRVPLASFRHARRDLLAGPGTAQPAHAPAWRRSLRVRLALWYSALIVVILILFGVAVYTLTASAITSGAESTVRTEARIAKTDLAHALAADPPYWPDQLSLDAVDSIAEPGVTVQVIDIQGRVRYRSMTGYAQAVPVPADALRAVESRVSTWYTASVENDRVRVEAVPVSAPVSGTRPAPIIGVLVVAQSLHDAQAELVVLRTLLIVGGLLSVVAALGVSWTVAARILGPLREVAATAGAIAGSTTAGAYIGGLSRRVRRPAGDDELAHLVDTFNTMLTALEDATVAQQRFVADASHELRAPLTTIQGNLALLRDHEADTTPAERREMLADAQAETLRLVRLVNDLLALARADTRGDGMASVPVPSGPQVEPAAGTPRQRPLVDLDRIVLDLVRQLRARLSAEGSQVQLEIGHVEPVRIRADPQEMRQLALIILDNAIKYTPPDRPGASVHVSVEHADSQALLRVRDTGMGIDAADLPHIFERFYRASRARDRQGTGLGLSIARGLAERYGGTIDVESSPRRGSTFTVRLLAPPIA